MNTATLHVDFGDGDSAHWLAHPGTAREFAEWLLLIAQGLSDRDDADEDCREAQDHTPSKGPFPI